MLWFSVHVPRPSRCFRLSAHCAREQGVDFVLVGDSLGMVVQGEPSTLPVTVDQIVYHCRAVARGLRSALLVADMPFGADATPERAFDAGVRMLKEGTAGMVKIEGAGAVSSGLEPLKKPTILCFSCS